MKTSDAWLRVVAAAMSCALASCGGGGGGDGGGGSNRLSVTANASGFQLVGILPGSATSNTVTFTLSGGNNGQTLYAAAVSGMPNLQANVLLGSDTQAMVTLTDSSGSGRSTGSVTLELCSDPNCSKVVWSQAYPVTSTRFQIATDPLTLAGSEGADTHVTLAVSPPDTDHLLTLRALDVYGQSTWLTATHDSTGNIAVTASAANLAEGSYPGTLMAASAIVPAYFTTQVQFNVGKGLAAPALADIVERADTTSAALQGSGALTFNGRAGAWTATSDSAWLVVDTPTGNGSGQVTYHVDVAAADAVVANWSAAAARITFASPGMTSVSSSVTYRRQLPEVALVTPSQVWPGQAATVRVTGRGLSQLTSVGQIRVGSQAATAGTIDSDSQATLQLPAQSAGSLQVTVANGLHVSGTRANLAVAAGRLAYAALPSTGSKSDIVYDPSRQAVFACDYYGGTLTRWQLAGGSGSTTSTPWPGIWRVTLSADRQTLYVLTQTTLYEVDPDSLQVLATHGDMPFAGFTYDEPMPLTFDQRLWLPEGAGHYFDLRTHALAMAAPDAYVSTDGRFNALVATPDGAHLFTADAGNDGFTSNGWYSAAAQTSTALPRGVLQSEYRANFDLDGGKGLFEWQWVYDTSTWTLVGTAALGSNEQGVGGILSPDGTRVYRLAGPLNSNRFVSDHIEVFDAAHPSPGSNQLPMIGTIPLADQAVGCSFSSNCDVIGRLAIDPLGSTLFWAGDQKLVVIPIPQGLAQPASAQAGVRRLLPATGAASRR